MQGFEDSSVLETRSSFDVHENFDTEDVVMAADSGDENGDDEAESDARHSETVSCLENLALSFLSQLTASLTPKTTKGSSSTQPDTMAAPKRIELNLASRPKAHSDKQIRMRTLQFPRKGKGASARSSAQLLKVANEAHEALLNESPMTKRFDFRVCDSVSLLKSAYSDLYYRDVTLFKSQTKVDTLVDDLAATFAINRSNLNIPSLIPHAQDVAEYEIREDISWVLVVEKDAVFQTLRGSSLTHNPALSGPGILITGKGYPDLATRQLVKTFSDNMPEKTRILALVDADAYGLDIVSVYKYGSARMYHENDSLAAERLEWIGVSASEALGMGLDRDELLPISAHDQRKALSLLRSRSDLPPSWKRELMQMLYTRRKAEIEVLHSLPLNAHTFKEDREDVGIDCVPPNSSSPLIRFVIRKINNTLLS
ncbi:topoisomerase acting in meiosis [Sanghuangporus baumii]|uniref:DNA topoisomerase (ATP-hydrolyzing) n=1 Tax=Sanghuangporus baumii TaxID=108892 RepID=A0A9Q5HVN5_SANBA|nr:topoisomerase acting in meiosis [Sanghuangporus baumii]